VAREEIVHTAPCMNGAEVFCLARGDSGAVSDTRALRSEPTRTLTGAMTGWTASGTSSSSSPTSWTWSIGPGRARRPCAPLDHGVDGIRVPTVSGPELCRDKPDYNRDN
jgi:hypothetical protein